MTITPANLDLIIYIGSDFSESWVLSDGLGNLTDLTGASAVINMYPQIGYPTPFLVLSTSNGGITFSYENGILAVVSPYLAANKTSLLTAQCGFYNFEITSPGGAINRILQGCVSVVI